MDRKTLETDPRTSPALLKGLQPLSLGKDNSTPIPAPEASLESLEKIIATMSENFSPLWETFPNELPSDKDEPLVERSTIEVEGEDGNRITVYAFRPSAQKDQVLPGILYTHGGAMTILKTLGPVHERWCTSLALQGAVVFLVDFRNAWGEGGIRRPFPQGLNDCASAVKYVGQNRKDFGVGNVVVQGESGGANLALAVALKAKKDGWIDLLDGVSAQAPYISGGYGWTEGRKQKELPSLLEFDGYVLPCGSLAAMAKWYAPSDKTNPLAWPYHASEQDLKGLPPHHITISELDPLKDEGKAYHRKLVAAGVKSTSVVVLGLSHGAAILFRHALPDEHRKEVREIVAFAKSL
ncbi:hypothetical protein PRZ48_014017 [Zasmidium cellare]|uniref:Alpha/beta hydrolase fold-3 domain-containing protein n=1 Tax=Zasmidium cellare TaxID=395010 RepID=A0ABR0E087_ZASCE|nr:hypothetical protein PRZ48_014017 [Zasmidium cellare]